MSYTRLGPAWSGLTHSRGTARPKAASHPSRAEIYARAEAAMRRGKLLVISGFAVSLIGIIGYCVVSLRASMDDEVGASFFQSPGPLVGAALGVLGLGTLLWLVGSFIYLRGAMDSDPDGPDPDLF